MEHYIFILNDQIIGAGLIPIVNNLPLIEAGVKAISVSKEIYNAYITDNNSIIWDTELELIIMNPDYSNIMAQKREAEFNREFFRTSFGYIRRKAHMKDGSTKDFITDLIPLMIGTPNIPVIVYSKPDFAFEVTEETLIGLQSVIMSSPELISECKNQAIIDFYGYNPMEILQQQNGELEIEEPEAQGELSEE